MKYNKIIMVLLAFALVLSSPAFAQVPTIANDIVMQFDATNIDGSNNSTLTNGQALTTWVDASGNGNDLTTVVGTPTFESSFVQTSTGYASLPVVGFDFTDAQTDYLSGTAGADVIAGYPVTIFIVSTFEDQSNGGARQGTASVFSIGNSAAVDAYLLAGPNDPDHATTPSTVFASAQYRGGFDPLTTSNRDLNDGDLHVATARFQSSTLIDIRVNGLQGPNNPNFDIAFPGSTTWVIGNTANSAPGEAELNGKVAEVLVYEGNVVGDDLVAIEDYLMTKWRGVFPDANGTLTYTSQTSGFTFEATETATIVNDGLADLTITGLAADTGSFGSDALTIEAVSFPVTVPARGGTFDFDVTWTSTDTIGDRDFTIDVTSDNPTPLVIEVDAAVLGGVGSGLTTYYDFNANTGSVVDDISTEGNDNDGDVIGNTLDAQTIASLNAGFGLAYRASEPGAANPYNNANYIAIDGNLNGTRDASLPTDLYFGTGNFAVSCWVYLEVADDGNQAIFGNVDWNRSAEGGGTRDGITLFRNGQMIPAIYADSTGFGVGEYRWFTGGNDIGQWNHWVITGGPGEGRLYLNGAEIGTNGSIAGDIGNLSVPFVLGNNAIPGGGVGGVTDCRFDEFGVWNRQLDAAEVVQIYEQGLQGLTLFNVGPQPSINVTDNRAFFNFVLSLDQTFTLDVTVQNNGQAPLDIYPGTNLTGPDIANMTINASFDTATTTTLNPGQNLVIPVDFVAVAAGELSAVLNMTHNTTITGTETNFPIDLTFTSQPNAVREDVWMIFE